MADVGPSDARFVEDNLSTPAYVELSELEGLREDNRQLRALVVQLSRIVVRKVVGSK
jgi:K+ transporter